MEIEFIIATWFQPFYKECVQSWYDTATTPLTEITVAKMDLVTAYQQGFELSVQEILGFVHDDTKIYERGWDRRVLREFEDPLVGLVGFGGAPGFCHPNLKPENYSLGAMGRIGFRSNMRNAEVHGSRMTGAENATILDGFAMFVRREVLEKAGGWPVDSPVSYWMYDAWLACITRELGYKIRIVGVDCDHLGGRSTGMNPNLKMNAEEAHEYVYRRFQKILPAMVEP